MSSKKILKKIPRRINFLLIFNAGFRFDCASGLLIFPPDKKFLNFLL